MSINAEIRNTPNCNAALFRSNSHVELNDKENSLRIPLSSCLTYKELKGKFENLGTIDAGGEAKVFKVRCKISGKIYALRLDSMLADEGNVNHKKNFYSRMVESQDKNPHRAKIFTAFWLQNNTNRTVNPFSKVPEGEFIRIDFENPQKVSYYREVVVMELGGKSVEKTKKNIDPLIFEIQSVFNRYCLAHAGISSCDEKLRNYVWVSTENETYNGKRLKDFSHWLYSFGDGLDLYIPRQDFIPKRVDFGNWQTTDIGLQKDWKKLLINDAGMEIDELFKLYPKPNNPADSILDMGALLKV